jgi:hypothetical protein
MFHKLVALFRSTPSDLSDLKRIAAINLSILELSLYSGIPARGVVVGVEEDYFDSYNVLLMHRLVTRTAVAPQRYRFRRAK